MATRIKKITLKKMSAKDFAALLKKLGACAEARKWAKGKTLQKVWATCSDFGWMGWLLIHAWSELGWPAHDDTRAIRNKADVVYWNKPFIDKDGIRDMEHAANVLRKYTTFK
jgi:hypothetical protein